MNLTDKEKLMIHASCILSLSVERGALDLKQAYKIIEAIRKNKLRSIKPLESEEIINQILDEFAEMRPFLELYNNNMIPE